jgi:hypothetical protein
MTPKDKAKELVNKFFYAKDEDGFHSWNGYRARQCALIAVFELLKDTEEIDGMRVINNPYWMQVKNEIEKL